MVEPTVPLKVEGVVVGLVSIGDDNQLVAKFTAIESECYLKELLLSDLMESISLTVDYIGESDMQEPGLGDMGHLQAI